MIELPFFVTPSKIEFAYARSMALKEAYFRGTANQRSNALRFRTAGLNAARDRNGKMLLFMEHAVEHLRRLNDNQQTRLTQEGYQRQDFSEFGVWREAYRKVDQLGHDESIEYGVFAWVYAAVYEQVLAV